MAFCKFSTEYVSKSYTLIDNMFFAHYLPITPPKLATIYLYGLYLCSLNDFSNNSSIENFANSLGYTVDEVMEAFTYWEEQGLIRIVNSSPIEIQYLPIQCAGNSNRRYNKDKYSNFNIELQNLISQRMITPNEYEEYYAMMEGFSLPDGRKFTPEAMLMIVRYCVQNKGANINYRYILTVARNWATEGYITPEQIEQKLSSYNEATKIVGDIMKALGSSRKTSLDEHEMYLKWRNTFEFTDSVILFVAKNLKKTGQNANFEKLNKKLQKYYELHMLSEQEILEYESNKDKIYSLAREINKKLGVYYDDVSNQVETYINPWLAKGFEPETLLNIAQDCYQKAIRTLKSMDDTVNELFNAGIITQNAYESHTKQNETIKEKLAQILKKLGITRNVTNIDIDFWKRWVDVWGFDEALINLVVDFAQKRGSNISYINTILADWHNQNIYTLDKAKESLDRFSQTNKTTKTDDSKLNKRTYSEKEINSVFDNVKEIEI